MPWASAWSMETAWLMRVTSPIEGGEWHFGLPVGLVICAVRAIEAAMVPVLAREGAVMCAIWTDESPSPLTIGACTRKPERHISEKLSCGPFENNRNMSSTLILLGL